MAKDKQYAERLLAAEEARQQALQDRAAQRVDRPRKVIIERGDELKIVPVEWLWEPYFQKGAAHALIAASSAGKSVITTDLAARITNPALGWPDGTKNEGKPRRVLFMSSEDDIPRIVAPRFIAAGGDLTLAHFIRGSCPLGEDGSYLDPVALDRDLKGVLEAIHDLKDIGFLVIDPATNHLGRAGYTNTQQVRDVLMPVIINLCQDRGITLVNICHLNKKDAESTPIQQLTLGAEAFTGLSRQVFFVGKGKDDDTLEHTLAEWRNHQAPSLRYRTASVEKEIDGKFHKSIVTIEWLGKSTDTAEDIMKNSGGTSLIPEMSATVMQLLSQGARRVSDIKQQLTLAFPEAKLSDHTMKRIKQAKKNEIQHSQKGKNDHFWEIVVPKARKF